MNAVRDFHSEIVRKDALNIVDMLKSGDAKKILEQKDDIANSFWNSSFFKTQLLFESLTPENIDPLLVRYRTLWLSLAYMMAYDPIIATFAPISQRKCDRVTKTVLKQEEALYTLY